MNLTQKIASRIQKARILGDAGGPCDFQLRVTEKGAVLTNLRTHRAEFLSDEEEDSLQEKNSIVQ